MEEPNTAPEASDSQQEEENVDTDMKEDA